MSELQTTENTEIQKKVDDLSKSGMVETVRKTIFPGSTDPELQLYFYQCVVSGVHPLSKKIVPIKFKEKDGSAKVSFITTIDHARSKADATDKYEGQDPPFFEGDIIQIYSDYSGNKIEVSVPEKCTVNVWKKGIPRPFVGEACWTEFYPGDKKGMKYIQMPRIMLAKCAEMQALRRAFPDQLHNLYSEEEMLNVIEGLAEVSSTGSKPKVSEQDVSIDENQSGDGKPTDEQRFSMKLISEPQAKRLYAICKSKKVEPEWIANFLKIRSIFWITANKQVEKNYDSIVKTVEEKPSFFDKYKTKPKPAPKPVQQEIPPTVMDSSEFVSMATTIIVGIGMTIDKASVQMDMEFGFKDFESVPASQQSSVIDWLESLQDQSGS
jgi:phage recombination protein Bet